MPSLVSPALAALVLALAWPVRTHADTLTTEGDRSGEGATPFTGIAQTPEATLYTGASSTSVAIEVPPGRKNLTPQLVLNYSSSGGPSVYGYGWALPIGRIERSSKWGSPRCADAYADDFVLSMPTGTFEMRAVGGGAYRPRIEEGYLRAVKESDGSWTAWDRSGIKYRFGETAGTRIAATQSCGTFTVAWALDRIEDPNGNAIQFTYVSYLNVLYPLAIHYGGNSTQGLAHMFHVDFAYQSRIDQRVSGRLAVPTYTALRLGKISVRADNPPSGQPPLVRVYKLTYDGDLETTQSRLNQVAVYAVDSLTATPLYPPQQFAYSPPVASHGAPVSISMPSGFEDKGVRARFEGQMRRSIMDMNGDALPDLIYAPKNGTGLEVHLGTATGGFSASPILWDNPGRAQQNALRFVSDADNENTLTVDTIDLTGDGIPDYVVASSTLNPDCRWRVYPGRKPSGGLGWRFDATPILWQSPHQFMRIDASTEYFSHTYQDLVDMNGDGRLDLVRTPKAPQAAPWGWEVYLNTGAGFDSEIATPASCAASSGFDALTDAAPPAQWISETDLSSGGTAGSVMTQLADFNGDGLPEYLRIEIIEGFRYVTVHANIGGRFEGTGVRSPIDGLAIRRWTNNSTVEDLFDVTGDGLPDRVFLVAPPGGNSFDDSATWTVAANQGNALAASQPWSGILGPIRKEDSVYTRREVVDLNGDGLLDRIGDFGASGWQVQFNQSTTSALRPHLLTVSRNGVGGTHTMRYLPSTRFVNVGDDGVPDLPSVTWVLRDLASSDGLDDLPPPGLNLFSRGNPEIAEGHLQVTHYTYEGGYFDPVEREFLGFRDVWVTKRNDESGSSSLDNVTCTTFGQTTALRGRALEVKTYAGHAPPHGAGGTPVLVASQVNTWGTMALFTGRTRVYLQSTSKSQFDLAGGAGLVSVTEHQVDPNTGNALLTRSRNVADTDWIRTQTQFAAPDGGSEVRDRPTRIWSDYKTPAMASAATFLDKRFYYDGTDANGRSDAKVDKGNVKRTVSYVTADGGSSVTSYNGYDGFGNITTVTDERGGVTTTTYDSAKLHPLTVTNALTHVTQIVTDQRWGKPSSVTDANGNMSSTEYDTAGRVACVRRPLDGSTGCADASQRYEYHYAAGTPGDRYSWVAVSRIEPNHPDGYLTSTQYYDGMGRPRYMSSPRVVQASTCTDPPPTPVAVISHDTEYDAAGRVTKVFAPYQGAFLTRNNGVTTSDYRLNDLAAYRDPLHRVNRVTQPDGQSTRAIYEQERSSQIDAAGNKSSQLVDVFGRTIRSEAFNGQGATPYSFQDLTHDGAGRVLTTRINNVAATSISNTYDLLGRRLQMIDPSSGTWTYTYDAAGNVVREDDPKVGQYLKSCYDAGNRLTKVFYATTGPEPACTAAAQVTYTYDQSTYAVPNAPVLPNEGVGRLTSVQDTSGSVLYRYDERGRSVAMSRQITIDSGSTRGSFVHDYDVADRLERTTYPDTEVVRVAYDASGQARRLYRLNGTTEEDIVSRVCYDHHGRKRSLRHGNDVVDTMEYGSAATNHRLRRIQVQYAGASSSYLKLGYSAYDARGFLTRLEDERDAAAPLSNTLDPLDYDHMGRLVAASGPSVAEDYDYDALGRIESKGPRDFSYSSSKPFQLISTTTGGPLLGVNHDANGNRSFKQDSPSDQTYTYDHEDRLTRIDVGANTIRFQYDYRGQKTAQIVEGSPGLTIRYYSDLSETTSDGYHMRYYFFGGMRVASRRISAGSWQAAAVDPGVRFAATGIERPALALLVGESTGWAVTVGLSAFSAALLLSPPWRRRRRSVGVRVRDGHVVGTALLTVVATLPWPLLLLPQPAAAQKGGGVEDRHYHQDHLGSVQVTTDAVGACLIQTRYTPYGDVRERRNCSTGAAATVGAAHRYEFTDYETEVYSKLAYAGARFYDPSLASFLTIDPAREFNSPYTYTNWNPTNLTDPTGACVFGLEIGCAALIGIGIAASAVASAIDTGVRTGDVGAAFKALGISLGVGVATAGLGAAAVSTTVGVSATLDLAVKVAGVGSGAYGLASSIENGSVAGAVVGGALLVLSVYGLASELEESGNYLGYGDIADPNADPTQGEFVLDWANRGGRGGVRDNLLTVVAKHGPEDGKLGHAFVGIGKAGAQDWDGFYPQRGSLSSFEPWAAFQSVPSSSGMEQIKLIQGALGGDPGFGVAHYWIDSSGLAGAQSALNAYGGATYNALFQNCTHMCVDAIRGAGIQPPFAGFIARPSVFSRNL